MNKGFTAFSAVINTYKLADCCRAASVDDAVSGYSVGGILKKMLSNMVT